MNRGENKVDQTDNPEGCTHGVMKAARAILVLLQAGGLLAVCLGTPATAQTVNPTPNVAPSENLSNPPPKSPAATVPSVEHLLGDWGGLRRDLGDQGINILIDNSNEFGSNVSGGTRRSTSDSGQVGVEADIDWEKLAGITGFSTHSVVVARYGANLSSIFGDQLSPAQEIYGAGGNVVAHFVYTYGELSLRQGRIDIAVGRIPVGTDFATSPLYCNFMNNDLCGNPKALSGQIGGFNAWPDGTWAGRTRVRPTDDTYLQLGIYQVNQNVYGNGAGFRSAWILSGSGDSGVEVPAEIAWQPKFGGDGLPGNYKLGLGFDSSSYPVFSQAVTDSSATLPGKFQHGRLQYWALANQMVLRNGSGSNDGLILLAGYVHDDPASFVRSDEVFGGFVDQGFWPARPADTISVLLSYQKISNQLNSEQTLDQLYGLPLANGATGVQTREIIAEVSYAIHVIRGVTFAPDFQYINRPNAQANIPDAVVLGFKSHVEF